MNASGPRGPRAGGAVLLQHESLLVTEQPSPPQHGCTHHLAPPAWRPQGGQNYTSMRHAMYLSTCASTVKLPAELEQLADGLLKLHVPGAGFLADLRPLLHTTSLPTAEPKKVLAPASTFLMAPKATKSFPNPALPSDKVPDSNLPDSRPFADYTERGTILVISQPAGQSCAVVGGIMATRIKHLGAKGLVVDGRVRDVVALNDTQLPIWSRGTSVIGAGAETKLHARNVPIRVGETIVEPGDIVMIDPFENGVVAVPQAKVDELLELLPKLVGADERVLADVEQGVSVQEAFKRHRS